MRAASGAASCGTLVHLLYTPSNRSFPPPLLFRGLEQAEEKLLGAPLAALSSARVESLWAGETWVSSDPYILAAAFQPCPAWHLVLTQPQALQAVLCTLQRGGEDELHY